VVYCDINPLIISHHCILAMQHLLCAEEEGALLWTDAFAGLLKHTSQDRQRAHIQLIELVHTAEVAGIENQDDRGCVALRFFLDSVPDEFFLASASTMYRENRDWWRSQIEESMNTCPNMTSLLQKRVKNLRKPLAAPA
jgi:hypothetical protein